MALSVVELSALAQGAAAVFLAIFTWKSSSAATESAKSSRYMEWLARETERKTHPLIRGNDPKQVSPGRFRFDVYNDGYLGTGIRQVVVHVKENKRQESGTVRSFELRLFPPTKGDRQELHQSDQETDRNVGPSAVRSFLAEAVNPDIPLLKDLSKGLILEIIPVAGERGSIWVNSRTL